MTSCAIIQPCYLPWRGFFDMVHQVEVFVHLDDVQYTVRDWRNRNQIKLATGGLTWLTVPVVGGRDQAICDVLIDNQQDWQRKHLRALQHSYGRLRHFDRYFPALEAVLLSGHTRLADLDVVLTEMIAGWLGSTTRFVRASTLRCEGVKDARLLAICSKLGANSYLSGPAAKAYISPSLWEQAGVELRWQDYSGYPEYPQIGTPFRPAVTVMDLLFEVGPEAPEYIWGKLRVRST